MRQANGKASSLNNFHKHTVLLVDNAENLLVKHNILSTLLHETKEDNIEFLAASCCKDAVELLKVKEVALAIVAGTYKKNTLPKTIQTLRQHDPGLIFTPLIDNNEEAHTLRLMDLSSKGTHRNVVVNRENITKNIRRQLHQLTIEKQDIAEELASESSPGFVRVRIAHHSTHAHRPSTL